MNNPTNTTPESRDPFRKYLPLAILGLCLIFVLTCVGSSLSYRSSCVAAEAGIKAQAQANASSYDTYWKTIREMAQVPEMYVGDLEKVYRSAIQGRYGEGGSKAMFQFIKEHNPTFDASLYTKIQTAIEGGRARFNADQAQLLDKKAAYETLLGSNQAMLAGWMYHFPTINLADYKIVTSERTDAAFTTGHDDEVKLR